MEFTVDPGQHQGVPPRATPHPLLRKLGHRVRTLRDKKGWTQEDLAGEAGLDRSYVSGLESGRRNPTYLRLAALAKALNIPLPSLIDIDK
jgi:transcriptional regulator with XRE-family HTH domain